MKKNLLNFLTFLSFCTVTNAQNVNIPDPNFKAFLLGINSINTNMDTEIQVSEANAFTGGIDCTNMNITDLTGIEAFTALKHLTCRNNDISSLDLTQNTALEKLNCDQLYMESIDLTQNTALVELRCKQNNFSVLDLTQNPSITLLICDGNDLTSLDLHPQMNLEHLSAGNNNISSIDLTQHTALTGLFCLNNNISTLNTSQNTALETIRCEGNNITSLDISQNLALTTLWCSENNLTELYTDQNSALADLSCAFNDITSLDLSQNLALTQLSCSKNELTSMNLKNLSPNTLTNVFAYQNPNLSCIEVDDVAAAAAAWTHIDAAASFNTDCNILVASIDVQGQGGASTITTTGGSLQMEASVLPSNAINSSYTWSITNGTGSATISTAGLVTALSDGTVTVTATANDGSGVTGNTTITISNQTTNTIEQDLHQRISIFPNPVTNQLMLDTDLKIESVTISTAMGQMVGIVSAPSGSINLQNLPKGVYLLKMNFEDGMICKKVIKE